MRNWIEIINEAESAVVLPTTPITGVPIGTVVMLVRGGDFDETHKPFVATIEGWKELDPLGGHRRDATLREGGEMFSDEEITKAGKLSLVSKPNGVTINKLAELDALPEGSSVEFKGMDGKVDRYTKTNGLFDGVATIYHDKRIGHYTLVEL